MSARREPIGDELHASRYVEVGHVGRSVLPGRGDAHRLTPRGDCGELLWEGIRHVQRGDPLVTPDPDMILAADVERVFDVSHHVCGSRLASGAQERHEVNADHAAALCREAQRGIVLVARVREERRAPGMRERDRSHRCSDPVEGRPRAAVREIHEDPLGVHSLDRLPARSREPLIARRKCAAAEQVAVVVGELDDADTESLEQGDPFQTVLKRHGVLQTVDDAEPARGFCVGDVGRSAHAPQEVRAPVDLHLPR